MTSEPVETDGMCPNCVTPWKCNGPHRPPWVPVAMCDWCDHPLDRTPAPGCINPEHNATQERPGRMPTVEEAEAILLLVRSGWLKLELTRSPGDVFVTNHYEAAANRD